MEVQAARGHAQMAHGRLEDVADARGLGQAELWQEDDIVWERRPRPTRARDHVLQAHLLRDMSRDRHKQDNPQQDQIVPAAPESLQCHEHQRMLELLLQ